MSMRSLTDIKLGKVLKAKEVQPGQRSVVGKAGMHKSPVLTKLYIAATVTISLKVEANQSCMPRTPARRM